MFINKKEIHKINKIMNDIISIDISLVDIMKNNYLFKSELFMLLESSQQSLTAPNSVYIIKKLLKASYVFSEEELISFLNLFLRNPRISFLAMQDNDISNFILNNLIGKGIYLSNQLFNNSFSYMTEILENKSVDLILADIPYQNRKNDTFVNNFMNVCSLLLYNHGNLCFYSCNLQQRNLLLNIANQNGFTLKEMIQYNQVMLKETSYILRFTIGANATFNKTDKKTKIYNSKKMHPIEKDANLVSHLLQAYSNPKDVVFIPFAGTGNLFWKYNSQVHRYN